MSHGLGDAMGVPPHWQLPPPEIVDFFGYTPMVSKNQEIVPILWVVQMYTIVHCFSVVHYFRSDFFWTFHSLHRTKQRTATGSLYAVLGPPWFIMANNCWPGFNYGCDFPSGVDNFNQGWLLVNCDHWLRLILPAVKPMTRVLWLYGSRLQTNRSFHRDTPCLPKLPAELQRMPMPLGCDVAVGEWSLVKWCACDLWVSNRAVARFIGYRE